MVSMAAFAKRAPAAPLASRAIEWADVSER
jgi:hypothetical protein